MPGVTRGGGGRDAEAAPGSAPSGPLNRTCPGPPILAGLWRESCHFPRLEHHIPNPGSARPARGGHDFSFQGPRRTLPPTTKMAPRPRPRAWIRRTPSPRRAGAPGPIPGRRCPRSPGRRAVRRRARRGAARTASRGPRGRLRSSAGGAASRGGGSAGPPSLSPWAGGAMRKATIVASDYKWLQSRPLHSAFTRGRHRCLQSFHRLPKEASLPPILQAEGRGLQAPRGGRTCQQRPTFRSQMGTPRSPGPLPARLEARGSRGWAKGARGGTAQSMFQIPEFEPSEQEDSSSADRGLGPSLCSAPGLLRDLSHPQGLPTSRSHHGGPGAVETRSRHSSYPAGMEEDEGLGEEPSPFRGRSRSAPPNLWAARRYGRELRRMSDEFDGSFKGLPRPKSAGTATQMRQSSSWTRIFQSWWDRNLGRGSAPSQ